MLVLLEEIGIITEPKNVLVFVFFFIFACYLDFLVDDTPTQMTL